jgi:hypothetical protein
MIHGDALDIFSFTPPTLDIFQEGRVIYLEGFKVKGVKIWAA